MEFLQKGGWFMVPILLCLLITLAITIERFFNLRLKRYISGEEVSRVRNLLHSGQFDGALQICRSQNLLFNRLLETAITFRTIGTIDLRQLLEDQSRQEAMILDRFLPVLRTVATIAPLLGLLGTVAGMIKVFHMLSIEGMGRAMDLSSGISEALITTAAGMCVAIPAIVLYNYFDGRAGKIMLRLEKELIEMMLLIRGNDAVQKEA